MDTQWTTTVPDDIPVTSASFSTRLFRFSLPVSQYITIAKQKG